ncbi:glycoside hydrolase family 3 protein [Pricia sp. S334]|uniref:beta-N-acetylhexosaminidase n=1 Tax=Pricia mediterranea TaxID=3076079 RepID=A0ABU3L8T6_9FLAO|nr:glycoside hydrolase family 3 protein [Pricia sp. S334]MDT7830155.1 glycoside hydrolase family 3 protein [Pricia sp. S334]
MTLREKIGQLFMPAAFINDTEAEIRKLEKLIREHHIGSLCFFHSRASAATNFEGTKKIVHNENSFETLTRLVQRFQQVAKYPLLIAIDAEWGLAMRVENTPQYPYAITLGAIAEERSDLIYEVGKSIARDCRAAGIHWNLAPCVDINSNPLNPVIGYRSFGEQKSKVIKKAIAFVKGTQSEGILTSIKHFPGHGDTGTDSHLELPLIDKPKNVLLENELRPFEKLIAEGADSVMVGHLSIPALAGGKSISSSLSPEIIKGVLRDEMGYNGVVISDALNMHAVAKNHPIKGELEWLAFDAGNDILCFAEHVAEGIETILQKASVAQIETSFKRVWGLKEKINASWASENNSSTGNEPSIETHPMPETDSSNENDDPTAVSTSGHGEVSELSSHFFRSLDLNRKLATESLTLLKGTPHGISEFKKSDFAGIAMKQPTDNHFFKTIQKEKDFPDFSSTDSSPNETENILLALFPPQVKPSNRFGFSKEELIFINELIAAENVVLYLFGNPYVLNLIEFNKAKAVIIAYQNFIPFQKVAAAHFLGTLEAQGKLPVRLAP